MAKIKQGSNNTAKANSEIGGILRLYREAVSHVPILKYSWVLIATICILVLAAYFKIKNSDVFIYAIAVLVISFFGFIFSILLRTPDKFIRVLLYFLITCIILTMSTAVLGFASFIIWEKPEFYKKWFPNRADTLSKISLPDNRVKQPDSNQTIKRANLIRVPKGSFIMGSSLDEAKANFEKCKTHFTKPQDCKLEYFTDECPERKVWVDEFWIDDKEATQFEYQECVDAGKCSLIPINQPTKGPNKPIVGLRWIDAFTYCQWRGKRLPTEAEWEKAARWDPRTGETYKYPWGNMEISCDKANYGRDPEWSDECLGDGKDRLADVDAYPDYRSAVGAYNMVGNAWEIVFDDYKPDNSNFPLVNPKIGTNSPSHMKVLKGGGWELHSVWVRPADRYFLLENAYEPAVGCRCAASNGPK